MLFALLVCFLSAAVLGAQERREIAVSVVDKDGNFVEGLRAENFRGEFRGQPVTIASAAVQGGNKYVVGLLDTSASGKKQWARTWMALEDLVVSLGRQLTLPQGLKP